MVRALAGLLAVLSLSACSLRQHHLTGEPLVFALDADSGAIVDRDVLAPDTKTPPGAIPHKGEIIAIVVNNVFLRHLRGFISPHVLVYAEVFDDGQDDPSTALAKVLFNEVDQPSGVNLGLADRILYGPTPYKGFPIRIRFSIVQLNKDKKETASKLINAAGSVASGVQPQGAPAVGIVMQVAQLINALTKDDFELRFDLTLHPVERQGVVDVRDENVKAALPQRHGRPFAVVGSLRMGSFVVMKRELAERVGDDEGALASTLAYDWGQKIFPNGYLSSSDGKLVITKEILRLQGGYLYRIVSEITDAQGRPLEKATVKLRWGPNQRVDFELKHGLRQRFMDQTYIALTVLNGLPIGLDQEALRSSSKRDLEQISKLLDNPGQAPLSERIGPRIDELAASVKTVLEQRRIAEVASRRVGRDPAFRISTEYPVFWTSRIASLASLTPDTFAFRDAVARNAAVLQTASDLILNLPVLRPDDSAQMAALSRLDETAFEAVPDRPGVFKLTRKGLDALVVSRAARP